MRGKQRTDKIREAVKTETENAIMKVAIQDFCFVLSAEQNTRTDLLKQIKTGIKRNMFFNCFTLSCSIDERFTEFHEYQEGQATLK